MEFDGGAIANAPKTFDTYVVQQGDSLWTIAGKSDVYGNGALWRRLYDANRDRLKSPGRIWPGMTLRVPRTEAATSQQAAQATDSDTVFTK